MYLNSLDDLPRYITNGQSVLTGHRERLAEIALNGRIDHLAHLVNQIAEHTGSLDVLTRAHSMHTGGAYGNNLDRLASRLAEDLLTTGADDTWSGRENDAKRARFDGARSAVAAILDAIESAKLANN